MSGAITSILMIGIMGFIAYYAWTNRDSILGTIKSGGGGSPPSKPIVTSSDKNALPVVASNNGCYPNDPGHCINQQGFFIPSNSKINTISDTVTISKDLGNKIPKNSDMLYLLSEFIPGLIAPAQAELNILVDSSGQSAFVAVYRGAIKSRYTLPVIVGHKYQRTINTSPNSIKYIVKDLTTGKQQQYIENNTATSPSSISQGVEYRNKSPGIFPKRFDVQTTMPVTTPFVKLST